MSEAKGQNDKRPKGKGAGPTRSFDGSTPGPGSQIGPFRVKLELGRGGAGVVYLAHDTKLDREVAIKSLPPEVKDNPKALSRFNREARVLASLNHPNIATIYDELEGAEGLVYLILEYVPGQTLAERIAKCPLKLEEALTIALQIAEAVAAAHEHDVIHRDLKAGNIKITQEGKVKVLDFGLAKVVGREPIEQQSTVTEPGRIVGTPAYMSPEQARGKATDKRADIWSFGCVLYEMLTGRIPFKGETISDTLAAILEHEPNWQELPESTPANIVLLLRRCLEKEPHRRLRDIGDIAITLEETTTELQRPTLPMKSVKVDQIRPTGDLKRILPWLVTGLAMVVIVLLGIIIGLKLGGPAEQHEGTSILQPTVEPIKAIVVLPFDNLSGDPEQEYFVDGMTYELNTELGKISALIVKGQYSARRYKGTEKQIPEIAKELGVDAVITGSVFKPADANNVRITAQLIHGLADENLWGDSYEDDLTDVITLQRKVVLAIAKEIKVKLTPQEEKHLASARPVNPEAYKAYLLGRHYYSSGLEQDLKKAIKYFEQALEIDSTCGLAYAGLAEAYGALGALNILPPEDAWPNARSAVEKALAIDEGLAEAHTSLAMVKTFYDWDWTGAERELRRALEINPNCVLTHEDYSLFLRAMERHDEALSQIERALELDPHSFFVKWFKAFALYYAGQKTEAIQLARNEIDSDPDQVNPLWYWCLGNFYAGEGRYEEALVLIKTQIKLMEGDVTDELGFLGYLYGRLGRKAEALKQLEALDELATKGRYVSPVTRSLVYIGLDDKDKAFACLEKGYQTHAGQMSGLKAEFFFDTLRDEPYFKKILQRMNFPEAPASESATKPVETAQAPIEKIAVPARKRLHPEPLPSQISLLMSRGNSIALSSDGRYLVYVGVDALGTRRLYLRDMENDFDPTPLRGTEGATCPFFRPDGRWIGFFAEDRSIARHELKKVSIKGGAPEFICNVPPLPCGGCWSEDDSIIFSPMYHESLIKVPATGGAGQRITELDPNSGEYGHLWPDILPGGKGVIYTLWDGESFADYTTMVKWKNRDEPQELLSNSSFARYVPTGHLVFIRQGSLRVVPFDVDNPPSGVIREDARILWTGLGQTVYGGAQFTIAGKDGTFARAEGATPLGLAEGELVWVNPEDRNAVPIPDSRKFYDEWARPQLSPDEGWIALHIATKTHLSRYKLGAGWFPALTSMKGCQGGPVWEPGGNHIAFYHQSANSPPDVYWQPIDNSSAVELLHSTEDSEQGTSFSPDGKYLAMTVHHVDEASRALTSDISMFNMQTREKEEWTKTPKYNEWGADFSPDGKWIVYVSNETGNNEVWIREFQGDKRERISTAGGSEAMWSPDRSKLVLYYRGSRQLWEAEVEIEPQFKVVRREPLFDDVYIRTKFPGHRNYDVSKDGKRFLMIKQVDEQPAPVTQLKVVTNWFEELKQSMRAEED